MSDPVLQSSNSKKRTVPDDAEDVDLREMKKHRGEPPQSSRQVVSKKRRNRRKKKQPIVMEGDSRAQSQSSLARTAGAKKVSAHLASKSTTKKAFPHAPQPRVDAVVAVAEVANLPVSCHLVQSLRSTHNPTAYTGIIRGEARRVASCFTNQ